VVLPAGLQYYTYNADGQRTRRKVDGVETWQVHGFDGELLAEYAANAAPSAPQFKSHELNLLSIYFWNFLQLFLSIFSSKSQLKNQALTEAFHGLSSTFEGHSLLTWLC
jgi:hypothetical protein